MEGGQLVPIVSCRRGAKSYVRPSPGDRPRAACVECATGRELVANVIDVAEVCTFTFAEPESGFTMVIAEAVPRCDECGDVATVCARCARREGGLMAS
jgi:hypothetical protein